MNIPMKLTFLSLLSLVAVFIARNATSGVGATASNIYLGVKTELPFKDNPNRLLIKIGKEGSANSNHNNFINKKAKTGWGGKWNFSASGILTARACLAPNLIGFVDIDKVEAPEITKHIELVEAIPLTLNLVSPSKGVYVTKEFGRSAETLKMGLESNGDKLPIISVCEIKLDYIPKADFTHHFVLKNGVLEMKPNRVDMFEIDLQIDDVTQINITVLGLTENNGERFGFTATQLLQVAHDF